MFDWSFAVSRVIDKSHKNKSTDRLDVIDLIVSEQTISLAALNERCGGGVQRDNRFIGPTTKWIHGTEKRASLDNWLPFDDETGTYTVNPKFAEAWKKTRGL